MFDKFFVGRDVLSSSNNGKYKPISRVTLLLDDANSVTAGDDTGYEIVSNCPNATQEIANDLLASLKGHEYQAYTADGANIDPSAELGDGITVDGLYSVISRVQDNGSGYSSISAPGEAEWEDDFPMDGPLTQMFNRKLAQTRSVIEKSIDELYLAVFGEEGNGEEASISVRLDRILSQVQGALGTDEDGNLIPVSSSIELALGEITLDVSNGEDSSTITLTVGETSIYSEEIKMTGVVTFSGLEAGTTKIDGGWIETDSIFADAIHLGGSIAVYKYLASKDVGGFLGYDSGFNSDSGIGLRTGDGMSQVVCTDGAARISYGINPAWGITQVVCGENSLTLEGYSLIQFKTDSVVRVGLDAISLYPADAKMSLGEQGLEWADVYAAGTSMSDLLVRIEALEKA